MVLCSIVIHGLSIPFFSLGRRVHSRSRTWSRHTHEDWTVQTRHVKRGEEIVINRDRVDMMEEGISPGEKHVGVREEEEDVVLPPSEQSSDTKREESEGDKTEKGEEVLEHASRDNPPDGNEILQEWNEGPHQVIERKAGPGEEVNNHQHTHPYEYRDFNAFSFYRSKLKSSKTPTATRGPSHPASAASAIMSETGLINT